MVGAGAAAAYSAGMTTEPPSAPARSAPGIPWARLAAVGAALSAAGSVALHAVGSIQHGTFIAAWGLDPELFPRSTQAALLSGYYALFDRVVAGIASIKAHPLTLLSAAVILAAYIAAVVSPWETRLQPIARRLNVLPPHWRRPLGHFGIGLLLLVVAPLFSLIAAAMFLAVPGLLGEGAGHAKVQRLRADFALGCQASKLRCVQIAREGVDVARGYVIDVSDEDMALFDVDLHATRLLPRKGLTWQVLEADKPVAGR